MPPITLLLDHGTVSAQLPDHWEVQTLQPAPIGPLQDERGIVVHALDHPVQSESLVDFAATGRRLAIIVPDKTRRSGTPVVLPLLLARLDAAGVDTAHIDIIFANGTHPSMTDAERRAIVGDAVADRHRLHEHDCHAREDMVHVGTTAQGTDVLLNRRVVEADRVIATGAVVHHYFAGFGGGPKLLMPGVAAYETAITNHRRTLDADGHFHPACRPGRLAGNPVSEDIFDAIRFFPPSRLLATVTTADGRIAHAWSGNLVAAHHEATLAVDRLFGVTAPFAADVTIVSCGGHPKDINFIQAHKALEHAAMATRPGGTIVLLAACPDGIGNDHFLAWFCHESDEAMRAAVLREYRMNAHTAVAMRAKARRFTLLHVGGIPDEACSLMGMRRVASLQDAVDVAAMRQPAPRCLLMPLGGITVPLAVPSPGNRVGPPGMRG